MCVDLAFDLDDGYMQIASAKEVEPSSPRDKFAPRFDGLRFIETLVTAHR